MTLHSERATTQAERLLALLRQVGDEGVTPLEALRSLGSFRLAARIYDLREAGHDIRTLRYKLGSGAVVARYTLSEPAEQARLWD